MFGWLFSPAPPALSSPEWCKTVDVIEDESGVAVEAIKACEGVDGLVVWMGIGTSRNGLVEL